MRHQVHDKKFNRDANARKGLFLGLLRNFALHGEIVTTETKGKVLKRLADKMIAQAKDNSMASRRVLHSMLGKRDMVNTLVDRIAPAAKDRKSGFVRVTALGSRRGDNTLMVKVSLVDRPAEMGSFKSGKTYPKGVAKSKKQETDVTKIVEKSMKKPAAKKEAKKEMKPAAKAKKK